MDNIILEITSGFVGLQADGIDKGIEKALASLGHYCNVDRVYLFLYRDQHSHLVNIHEWCNEGITKEIDNLQDICAQEELPWVNEAILASEILNIQDVSKLPTAAHLEKKIFEAQSIKALLVVPVSINEEVLGFLGFDSVKEKRKWNEHEINLLKILASNIGLLISRQRFESRLRESEENFKILAETSPLAMFMTSGIEQVIEYLNPAAVKLFGYTHDEIPTIDEWWPLAYPDDENRERVAKEWQKRLEHAITTGSEVEPVESVVTCKDGSTKDVLWYFSTVAKHNWVLGLDLTDRKKAEQALQHERDLSLDIINTQPAGIYRIRVLATEIWEKNAWRNSKSAPVVVELASEPFCKILNTTKEAFENNPGMMIDLIYPDDREGFAKKNEDAVFLEDFNWEGRLFIDDVIKWVRFESLPRPLENGDILWTGALTDITERKQMEVEREKLITQLQDKTAEQERFIYTVSHDLKSPLVNISGFSDLAEQDLNSGDQVSAKNDLAIIKQSAQRMKRLLDDLLEISRIGFKKNLEEVVNLNTLIDDGTFNLSELIKEFQTTIEVECDLPDVRVDKQRYLQVIENLVVNAARYSKSADGGSHVKIGVTRNAEELICYVKDNGIGIEADYLDKIFGLFERIDTNSDGTGVGLAIVKRIIETHGGRIWTESEGLGHGTTFFFTVQEAKQ